MSQWSNHPLDLFHTETVSVIHRYKRATVIHKIAVHELLVPKKSWLELMCSNGIFPVVHPTSLSPVARRKNKDEGERRKPLHLQRCQTRID